MLIAIDRSSFNYIFKYNSMTISISQILDLSNEILETEIQKTTSFIVSEFDRILPIFELDHEVLLLEIQKSELEINGKINLPFNSILKVYPLTGKAKNLLSGKLNQSIEISEAIFEGVIEQVKLIRSINNRKLLYNKLSKICLIQENPNLVFTQNVESIVELLLKNQSAGNSYLANLIQYNYNPNEISSGNIEFLEKIGIIAWITTKFTSEGYINSNYYKRCEEFKSKINEGDYVSGFIQYLNIIENSTPEFKISHDRINEISNEGQIEIDLFKVSYYFLAIKTKLNKNNSNLLDLFEGLIRDIHSDLVTMSHVLYLIAYSFSFEQLYEGIHILEKSALLKSKFIVRDTQTIFSDLENEKIKLIKEEEERIRLLEEERLKTEAEERNRLIEEEQLKAEEEERIRLLEEEQLKAEAEEKNRLEQEQEQQLKTEEEIELDAERNSFEIQSHISVNELQTSSTLNISENKNEEIEIGKTIELSLFDNTEVATLIDLKDSDNSTNNENENSIQQESNIGVSEPFTEYQNSVNIELVNKSQIEESEETFNSNSSTIGINEEEVKITDINLKIPKEKSKKEQNPKKKQTKKITETNETSNILEITNSEDNDSENRNSVDNIEQNPLEKSSLITVGIFVEMFLSSYLEKSNENKIKVKLWTDFMSEYFNEPDKEITLDTLMAQMKYKPYLKESMFESASEIEDIEGFFKNYNK